MNGASARTSPMKRPTRIVTPPRARRSARPARRRSSVIFSRSPWREQPRAAEPAPERVGGQVARAPRRSRRSRSAPRARSRPGRRRRRRRAPSSPRRDEPDERAGLQEREHADEQVGPGPERVPTSSISFSMLGSVDDAGADQHRGGTATSPPPACVQRPSLRRRTSRKPASASAVSSQPHFTRRAPPRSRRSTGSAAIAPASVAAAARARCRVGEEAEHGRAGAGDEHVVGAASRRRAASASSIAGHSARAASWRSLWTGRPLRALGLEPRELARLRRAGARRSNSR